MYNKKTIEDVAVSGKRVLVRCDFNVPLKDGKITSDKRIVEALPTIKYLLAQGAKVILCSHMGKPKGEVNPKYSLAPVAARLTELLGQNVALTADIVGEDAKAKVAALKDGEAVLLENVRFDAREEKIDYCKDMMKKAEEKGVKLLLPVDTTIAASFPDPIDAPIETAVVDSDKIPADKMGLDIGPKTMELYAEAAKNAKTVVWNGPMGVFENPTLAKGTIAVAKALAESDATTIVGGGDSAAACEQLGFADKITHISTGGGASLEFLEGLELPGIACLQDK